MTTKLIRSQNSTQKLGNAPFNSSFATQESLDAVCSAIAKNRADINNIQVTSAGEFAKYATKDAVQSISGNYITKSDLSKTAKQIATSAAKYVEDEVKEIHDDLSRMVETASGNLTVAINGAEANAKTYASAILGWTPAESTENFFTTIVTVSATHLSQDIASEHDRASAEEHKLWGNLVASAETLSSWIDQEREDRQDHDTTLQSNIDTARRILSADISAASSYHDTQEAIIHTALDPLSATFGGSAVHHLDGNDIVFEGRNFIVGNGGVIVEQTVSAGEGVYTNYGYFTELASAKEAKAPTISGAILTVEEKVTVPSAFITDRIVISQDINPVKTLKIDGNGMSFDDVNYTPTGFHMGEHSDANKGIAIGTSAVADKFGVAIGPATTAEEEAFIFHPTEGETQVTTAAKSHGRGTFNIYTASAIDEWGVWIGEKQLPTVISSYAITRNEADEKIASSVNAVSGEMAEIVKSETIQTISATSAILDNRIVNAKDAAITSATWMVNDESTRRIDDTNGLREEIKKYLPLSGGLVWGDLIVKNLDIADTIFHDNQSQTIVNQSFYDGTKDAFTTIKIQGYEKSDFDYLTSLEYSDTVFIASGTEVYRGNSIGEPNLDGFSGLERIQFGINATQIPSFGANNANTLTSVSLSRFCELNDNAFGGCTALRTVENLYHIDGTPRYLPVASFADCENFKCENFRISQDVILNGTLQNCKNISAVEIESAIEISNGCFVSMDSLSSISLPDGLQRIGFEFLMGCPSVSSVIIPSSVQSIGGGSFFDCSALHEIVFDNKTMAEVQAMDFYYYASELNDGTILKCKDGDIVIHHENTDSGQQMVTPQEKKRKKRKAVRDGSGDVIISKDAEVQIKYPITTPIPPDMYRFNAYLSAPDEVSICIDQNSEPTLVVKKVENDYQVIECTIASASNDYSDEPHTRFAPIVESSVGDKITIKRLWAPNERQISDPVEHKIALKLYTPSELLLKLAEDESEPNKVYAVYSASGLWNEHWKYSGIIETIENEMVPSGITFTRTSDLFPPASEIVYESDLFGMKLRFPRNNPDKILYLDNPPEYIHTMDNIGLVETFNGTISFTAGTGRLETIKEYFEEQNELTQYMERVTTSAFNTATSAYATATSAYDMALNARDMLIGAQTVITSATNTAISAADTAMQSLALITDAQEVVVSASNTATSAYDIAMSAYALSGVLQQIVDYLKEINGEE